MKKLVSVLLLFVMLLGCNVVEAAKTPSLNFLVYDIADSDYSNVSQTSTVKFKLNEPLLILDIAEENDAVYHSEQTDVAVLVDSLCDTEITVSSKTKVSDNGKKVSMENHIKSDVPFKANENLEGYIKTNQAAWIDFDLSDRENPGFDMIQYGYDSTKYITASDELFEDNGMTDITEYQSYMLMLDLLMSQDLNQKLIDSISENATITGDSSNVRIHFSDMGLKMYLLDMLEIIFYERDDSFFEDVDINEVKATLAMFKIFDDDALVIDYTLDSKGRISKYEAELNINFNIYDMLIMTGEETGPITKENSNVNFTVIYQSDMKYNAVTIQKPEITEENSIDFIKYEYPYYYEEYEDYEDSSKWYRAYLYLDIDKNCIVDGKIEYVRLRSFMEEMGYSVFYEDGRIFGETENPYTTYKALLFTVGGDTASTDIQDVSLDVPVFVKDGVSYISVNDCIKLTGYKSEEWSCYDFYSDSGYTVLMYQNENFTTSAE